MLLSKLLLILSKVFANSKCYSEPKIEAIPVVLIETFNDGTICPKSSNLEEGALEVAINPSIFGVTTENWKNNFSVTEDFFWCGKLFRLRYSETNLLVKVTAFCTPERYRFWIDPSNGSKNGEKCFFDNSINFINKDFGLPEEPFFPENSSIQILN
jgi:hypothetical protein